MTPSKLEVSTYVQLPYNKVSYFGNVFWDAVSPPSPLRESAMVIVTSTSSLTVSWTAPSGTSNVGGYMFTVTGEDCGNCVNVTDPTSMICSGWVPNNQTCLFEVRTICGFTSNPVDESVVLSGE